MKRELDALTDRIFDLVVIGGGIYGACVAWEAASRGLSVALLEKDDFAAATSANSLKIIHGGFRYLQHGDLLRMRVSMSERKILMRTAPHLVHPLPVLVPTYGHGLKGREAFSLGLAINDLLSFDRNQLEDPQKHIPPGRTISRSACLEQLPGLDSRGLNGGAVFYDAQVYNSERLVLAYLHSASRAGAVLANYAEVTAFLRRGDRIIGVRVNDRVHGQQFDVRARLVINTSGPWIGHVLGYLSHQGHPPFQLAKAINLVTKPLFSDYAVGLLGSNGYLDKETLLHKGTSLLFVAPWRGYSLIGTSYQAYTGSPDDMKATEQDVLGLLASINLAYPEAQLKQNDVTHVHAGLLPSRWLGQNGSIQLAQHYQIHDHRRDGLNGMLSVIGVKYTTARHVAEKTLDRVFKYWGYSPVPPVSAALPLYGGEIERFETYLQAEIQKQPCGLEANAVRSLVLNYGSAYPDVLACFDYTSDGQPLEPEQGLLKAQVLYAVRAEMALKLADVVLRRTESGTAGHPGRGPLHFSAQVMGAELGWDAVRIAQEVKEVEQQFFLSQS